MPLQKIGTISGIAIPEAGIVYRKQVTLLLILHSNKFKISKQKEARYIVLFRNNSNVATRKIETMQTYRALLLLCC